LDSRAVAPGDLYAALPGARVHGADFASAAVVAGAVAVLTDEDGLARIGGAPGEPTVPVLVAADPRAVLGEVAALIYGRPADELTMVGITGTNGKTTTAYLIESGLRALGQRTGLIGTVETRIGAERLASARTTPEATDLHAILAIMRESRIDSVVMEVSSHAMAQHRVDGFVFDVALFTNLSQDHLDYHHTMDDYFSAKAALFQPDRARLGVVCVDDEWGQALAHCSGIPVVTVSSTGAPADWSVESQHWPRVSLAGPGTRLELTCHLPGSFNLVNTAMAAVALVSLGHPGDAVQAAMSAPPLVPGRMEVVLGDTGDPRCIVDYAHTPDAVDAALAALRPDTPGRLVVVLGAGGDRDRAKRAPMGRAAARWADDLIITDDNPRSEDPTSIRAQIEDGARSAQPWDGTGDHGGTHADSGPRTVTNSDAGRAAHIALAVRLARKHAPAVDNTVVVLGKGHETGQDIAGTLHHFDDREALAAALRGELYDPDGRVGDISQAGPR
ncbi:MAG: UDP-N-acetylmuramoyl-L-alanyl-D-glutamate--2,6-diaminopimelate ligase, partial [Candidatus Phosphoribacter sp.]